jgi:hypothetical protein
MAQSCIIHRNYQYIRLHRLLARVQSERASR